MKKIIISSLIAITGMLAVSHAALADNAIMSIIPTSATSTVGSSFDITVKIDPLNNKVCVVKGTLKLDNLSCQKITLAKGLMAQTVPTCEAPNFTLGIPKCAITPENLFVVSVKGQEVGQASSSFIETKVIGVGIDVAYNTNISSYNIIEKEKEKPKIVATTTKPIEVEKPKENIGTSTGIEIPSGVGELNPIKDNGENASTTSTTTGEVATSTESNGLVATVAEAFASIPNKSIIALMLLAAIAGAIMIYFARNKNDIPRPPQNPNINGGF